MSDQLGARLESKDMTKKNPQETDNAGANGMVAAATMPEPVPKSRDSEAQAFITIEMIRPDGVKVRKMLGGGSAQACGEIQYPPEGHRQHWRRDAPRSMRGDEQELHAMCLSDLKQVSETLQT